MRRVRPVFAAGAALIVLALAGMIGVAPTASAAAPTVKAQVSGPSKAVRKARALKRCRTVRSKVRRRACVKRVNRRFAGKDKPTPVFNGETHYVEVGDDYYSPATLTIKSGDAVVWQWKPVNKDDHNVSMYSGPEGVNPLDFELGDAPAVGPDWRRVFKVRGTYLMGCSLHHLQRITITVE